jgi:collagenase-like PrtC family protease
MHGLQVPELVCPAGSLRALKLAIDAGADAVYLGLRNATNARNFAGLNFDDDQLREGVAYAHARGRQVLMALNTYADDSRIATWYEAVDAAVTLGADALIVADVAVMAYARQHHPNLRLHLSVQASATSHEAIAFYQQHYGIQRAVLPRVLTLSQVGAVLKHTTVDIEVFGFGSLCVMVEGRCALSSYATGQSPNNAGVCSPPSAVRWHERADAVEALGVRAIKIEGRQRSPAYVEQVTRVWRRAIDAAATDSRRFRVEPDWTATLAHLSEGQQHTLGAYDRPWR